MNSHLVETGCKPQWLTLELTENLMIGQRENTRRVFGHLRQLGVGTAADLVDLEEQDLIEIGMKKIEAKRLMRLAK